MPRRLKFLGPMFLVILAIPLLTGFKSGDLPDDKSGAAPCPALLCSAPAPPATPCTVLADCAVPFPGSTCTVPGPGAVNTPFGGAGVISVSIKFEQPPDNIDHVAYWFGGYLSLNQPGPGAGCETGRQLVARVFNRFCTGPIGDTLGGVYTVGDCDPGIGGCCDAGVVVGGPDDEGGLD